MTTLEHNCGGNVVINASKAYRLIAPSFSISLSGIDNMTLDVLITTDSFEPEFVCVKCKTSIEDEDLKFKTYAKCLICGKNTLINDMVVHSQIPFMCKECLKQIKTATTYQDIPGIPIIIYRYIEAFGLTKGIRTVPLYKALQIPIKY